MRKRRVHIAVFVADRDEWIGNVSSMQHARDQTPDGRFGVIPIDGHRYSAHTAPERQFHLAKPLETQSDKSTKIWI